MLVKICQIWVQPPPKSAPPGFFPPPPNVRPACPQGVSPCTPHTGLSRCRTKVHSPQVCLSCLTSTLDPMSDQQESSFDICATARRKSIQTVTSVSPQRLFRRGFRVTPTAALCCDVCFLHIRIIVSFGSKVPCMVLSSHPLQCCFQANQGQVLVGHEQGVTLDRSRPRLHKFDTKQEKICALHQKGVQ